ncbi:hypothetical protein F5Y14DRAFT_439346 [Nemania sp. NC0429]|nr:hypothetical protein F5Y14DRAFT_439346 [Nemania sp. NC0429]
MFDVTPEKYASRIHGLKRTFFETPPIITKSDADLTGKTAIVTGVGRGIGINIARQLLDLGLSKLIIGARVKAKGKATAKLLSDEKKLPVGAVEVWSLDLLTYDSIIKFAQRAQQLERLDIVVLNAEIINRHSWINATTHHEAHMQINYLSTALLLLLLLPVIESKNSPSAPGKITVTSSDWSNLAIIPEQNKSLLLTALDDQAAEVDNSVSVYGATKLMGQLFIAELARRVPPSVAIVNGGCPGFCHSTGLFPDLHSSSWKEYPVNLGLHLIGRAPEVGARVLIDAATRWREESHGKIIDGGKVRPMANFVYTPRGEKVRQQLWKETMDELSFAKVEEIVQVLSYR